MEKKFSKLNRQNTAPKTCLLTLVLDQIAFFQSLKYLQYDHVRTRAFPLLTAALCRRQRWERSDTANIG